MSLKVLNRNEILFHEGDPGDGLYYIDSGKVGIYTGYGTKDQKKIEELFSDQFVGEMGLFAGEPRSATVIALMDNTLVESLTEAEFENFFQQNPARVIQLMEQMSSRLRRITKKYLEVCREAYCLIGKDDEAPAGDAT